MSSRPLVKRVLEGLLVGIVSILVLGQALGQPVLVSYVETGSMEPTLSPGDGFIAVPSPLVGDIETGDVVIYRAERLHGGGLTTHRVVGVTERGYITKGDANAFTDQQSVEPPVRSPRIVAKALTAGGRVVVLPYVGTLVGGVAGTLATVRRHVTRVIGGGPGTGGAGLATALAAAGIVFYGVGVLRSVRARGDRERVRDRSRTRNDTVNGRRLVVVSAALLVTVATASMVLPGGVQQFGIVSADNDAPGPRVVQKGSTENATYPVRNGGLIPAYVVLESRSQRIDVQPGEFVIAGRSRVNATVTLSAPPKTGYYREFIVEYRYLAVLPPSVLHSLSRLHPWLPIVVIDVLLGLGILVLGHSIVGAGSVRVRTRNTGSVLDRWTGRL